MPTITPSDALIKAADNLVEVINGQLPKSNVTSDAVEQLMEIFKIQAKKTTCDAHAQTVLRENAQAQRVAKEHASATPKQSSPQVANKILMQFEIKDSPHNPVHLPFAVPVISKDDNSPPANNTRHQ